MAVPDDYDPQLSEHLARDPGRYAIVAESGLWRPKLRGSEVVWLPESDCHLALRAHIGKSDENVMDLELRVAPPDSIDLNRYLIGDLDEDAAVVRGLLRKWLSEKGSSIQAACGDGWIPTTMHELMQGYGFVEEQTGGGCTAWYRPDDQGPGFTLITEAEDARAPIDPLQQATVGHYKDTEDEGTLETGILLEDYLQRISSTHGLGAPDVQVALDFINRHRATIHQPPLDPAAVGWGPDDILIEAERIRRLPNPLSDVKARLLAW